MKNLRELDANPFCYIVPVIPCPLPTKLVKGEHFVLADLFDSILGSSSQAGSAQARVAERALVESVMSDQLPLAKQDPQPTPQAAKKNKKMRENKGGRTKAIDVGLESFMDWTDQTSSQLTEEEEDNMSSLTAKFTAWMRKRAASS